MKKATEKHTLQIEEIPGAYGINRQYAVTYGISHLAYGSTPEAAAEQFRIRFP